MTGKESEKLLTRIEKADSKEAQLIMAKKIMEYNDKFADSYGDRVYNSYVAKIMGVGIQSILALWLVLGTKGIINTIKKLRTAGLN